MKSSYDQQLEAELSKYKESNEKLQAEVVVLGSRIEAMVDEMKQLRELDRDRLEQQNNAVSAMRTQCSEEQKAHFEQLQRTSMVEKDQLRQDAQRVLAEVKQQHEVSYLSIHPSIYLYLSSIYLSICLSIYLSIYQSFYQSVYLSIDKLSIYLSINR
jgi:hypothetical protein